MSKYNTFKKILKNNPKMIFKALGNNKLLNWIPSKIYLKLVYRFEFGRKLNLNNPKTFNEKLQWLKLYDRRLEYVELVDKYKVREYISKTIGDEYLIPLIGVYNNVDEIDWHSLPKQFVLKCTHGSQCNIICSDKKNLDIEFAKKKLNKWLKRNWYWYGREWPYKHVKPKIICEKYMVDESGEELKDYKFFCFNGQPKLIQVDYNRFKNHKRNLYDTNWNYIHASIKYPTDPNTVINKPNKLEEMLGLARILSSNYPHVRVDLYYINNEIYFGELTFYHGSGLEKFDPKELEIKMGNWLKLSNR